MNRIDGITLKKFSIGNNSWYIDLFMNRFILVFGETERFLCSYDLNNLEKIKRSKNIIEILKEDSSRLALVRCSDKNIFIYNIVIMF